MKTEKRFNLKDVSFHHIVNIEYETYYNCEEYGCDDDFCCRCGKIENARVEEQDINATEIANQIYKSAKKYFEFNKNDKEIINYCIERIVSINKIYSNPDCFFIDIGPGYYGEEIDDVYIENVNLENDINEFINIKNNSERIEFILKLEYGEVFPKYKNKKWKVESINKNDVFIPSSSHMQKIDRDKIKFYEKSSYTHPRGIYVYKNSKYELVDGYHRFKASDEEKIKVIVGYE